MVETLPDLKVALDTMWTLITAMLVFWMNAGFGMLEAGPATGQELRQYLR